jgi:putative DNA-invertase from lambdoid prophage Rac
MSRVFGYGRVSTSDQSAANQLHELKAKGYDIKPSRWVVDEGVSGSVPAMARPGFMQLLAKLEEGDTLVVAKLDRLGRDAIDVMSTLDALKKLGVSVRVEALNGTDLNSSAGRFMLQMLAAVAELERNMIRERTAVAQARFVAAGGKLGRRPKTTEGQRKSIRQRLKAGDTVSALARDYSVSRATIISIREAATA